jgi:hypothetical protein
LYLLGNSAPNSEASAACRLANGKALLRLALIRLVIPAPSGTLDLAPAIETLTRFPTRTNDRDPQAKLTEFRGQSWNAAMKTGLTLTEVDERIAAIRENLDQLVEQSTADSSAGNDALNSTRIAEQEQELAELTEVRETLLRK